MADYSKMTSGEFEEALTDIVTETMTVGEMLTIPGVYEILAEEFNNSVLDRWAADNPAKAYPDAHDLKCDSCGEYFSIEDPEDEEELGNVIHVGNECPGCEDGTLRKVTS